jgi:glycoprotein-N-acetylgalactosamine 3-beta-galactosyltransferase
MLFYFSLQNVNVSAGDSRDVLGRGRFFPFTPEVQLMPGEIDPDYWYWKNIFYPSVQVSMQANL